MKSVTIPYRQENHGDFDAEWPVQRRVTGWWYITGYFSDPADLTRLYSYQFTVVRPRVFGIYPWLLHLALTDVQTGKHHFTQRLTLCTSGRVCDRRHGPFQNAGAPEARPTDAPEREHGHLRP